MNALQSYSSDDDESGNEAPANKSCKTGDPGTNYDDVGMDISEDSDDEAISNAKEKSGSKAGADASSAPSTVPPKTGSSAADNLKNQNDAKEGQRSSRSSPSRNRDEHQQVRKSKSKSPKAKSPRAHSPSRSVKNNHKKRSRSKSREREGGRSTHPSRGHSSREQSSQGHSGRSRDSRDSRRSRDEDRKRRDDDRRSRRSRSRSRSRDRRRSRSRSRDRRSRSRSRERRRRSRSHERKRPMDIRKAEAQQKLAALKAANPDLTPAELMRRSMEAQVEEVKKQTGITLPSYYNPATMNPMKFAEQERKKKLLWGNKSKSIDGATGVGGAVASIGGTSLYGSLTSTEHPAVAAAVNSNVPAGGMAGKPGLLGTASGVAGGGGGQASLWASTRFANDKDGKMAEKFRRLMGVKDSGGGSESGGGGGGRVGGGGVGGGGGGGGGHRGDRYRSPSPRYRSRNSGRRDYYDRGYDRGDRYDRGYDRYDKSYDRYDRSYDRYDRSYDKYDRYERSRSRSYSPRRYKY
ncbi:arginine/serine-rich coiled-coil protein 2-like isoform X2 [Macrobrachium nipponense]|uniref:arginine/serine-rich coiled-coil protein 2-like isoform X2 n=1 Tax=Macrobrachium nipponense TaxID=159736 RepID=UPI0030C7DFA1